MTAPPASGEGPSLAPATPDTWQLRAQPATCFSGLRARRPAPGCAASSSPLQTRPALVGCLRVCTGMPGTRTQEHEMVPEDPMAGMSPGLLPHEPARSDDNPIQAPFFHLHRGPVFCLLQTTSFPMSAWPTVWVGVRSSTRSHRWALCSHGLGAYGRCCCMASCTCCREIDTTMNIPPSAAAMHSRPCLIRAPGTPVWCETSATVRGLRGAGRATCPMSLLRATAATHGLSSVDRRLPGRCTRRRVPMAGNSVHAMQSLVLPVGCLTCAARAVASNFSAPGHTALRSLCAMRIVLTAMFQVCGHWGGRPSNVGWFRGSAVSFTLGAKRWWAVQCRKSCSLTSERSRYTTSEPPSSTYCATRGAAGVWVCC